MAIQHASFSKHAKNESEIEECKQVDQLAAGLISFLADQESAINSAHIYGAQSSEVQKVFSVLLRSQLGFSEEVIITPQDGFVSRARADFFYRLTPERGVLAEVERGGTLNNNHDLKDLWKTHISPDAQHLFLLVPNMNTNANGNSRERPFSRVVHRMSSFFGDSRRELDVLSVHIFGYGLDINE